MIENRILKFVNISNWLIYIIAIMISSMFAKFDFVVGVISGGLIVTVNFHILHRTLKKSLTPPYISSHQSIIAKYYIRFIVSGIIIFILISNRFVNPIGLFIGLSIVVASILLATINEFKKIILKEA